MRNQRQRGEGKIGCIVSLVVLLVLGAIAAKIVPYWWTADQFINSADELASRVGVIGKESVIAQLRVKASELELFEATKPGAVTVNVSSTDGQTGMCAIDIRFQRELDFYGITKYTWVTEKQIRKPWGRF